jgi:hypothetical protein
MKEWSAALAREVEDWPEASARPFFGFTALYRGDKIFAALPKSRAMDVSNSFAFKVAAPTSRTLTRLSKDYRIRAWSTEASISKAAISKNGRWFTFELSSGVDLHEALEWLATAYEAVAKMKTSR